MADLPFALDPAFAERLASVLDVEGKIPRSFEALGPIAGTDVLLVDAPAAGIRASQLSELGGRVTIADGGAQPPLAAVAEASADAVLSCWSWFRDDLGADLEAAERVLRPGGRLLVLHDYGRDDISRLRSPDLPEYTTWSRRDGWFLRSGFKVRVIHCWWTFDSVEAAAEFLNGAFGEAGSGVALTLKRPRLSYNVAIYHRTRGDRGEA